MIHIISPHIDDAVLSLGGFMRLKIKEAQKINVIYVFSNSNWTNSDSIIQSAPIEDNPAIVSKMRKKEEENVARYIGHTFDFFDFDDLPLRNTDTIGIEKTLIEDVVLAITKRVKKNEACFFPICHKHPDHGIVELASRVLYEMGYIVYYYEDLPYAANQENWTPTKNRILALGYCSKDYKIEINKKIDTLKLYESQMSCEWINCVKSYSYRSEDNSFYERVWRPGFPWPNT